MTMLTASIVLGPRTPRWLWWLPLVVLLAGCSSTPEPQVVEREVPVYPPAWMLEPCEQTPVRVTTFADLIPSLETTEAELEECASRMDQVREWADAETDSVQE